MTKHTLPKLDPAAVAFFREHAGTSYNPATETPEQGAERNARKLARAEAWLKADDDLRVDWGHDEYGDHSYLVDESEVVETCEYAALTNSNVDVLASLGCIDDATPEYRRVVEAELAYLVMPAELVCHHTDVELANGVMMTCGTCGSTWCELCAPTPAARCHWEAEHDDDEACTCLDPVGAGQNTPDGAHWTACPVHDHDDDDDEGLASERVARKARGQEGWDGDEAFKVEHSEAGGAGEIVAVDHDTARVEVYWHTPTDPDEAPYLVVNVDSEAEADEMPVRIYVNDAPIFTGSTGA